MGLTGNDDAIVLDASGFTNGPVTLLGDGGEDTLAGTRGHDSLDGGNGTDTARQLTKTNQTLADGLTPGTAVTTGDVSDLSAC